MGELETSLDSSIVRLHFKINKPLGHLQQWSVVCSFTETLVGVPYEQLTQISHAAVVYFQDCMLFCFLNVGVPACSLLAIGVVPRFVWG